HQKKFSNENYPIEAFEKLQQGLDREYEEILSFIYVRDIMYASVMLASQRGSSLKDIQLLGNKLKSKNKNWNKNLEKINLDINKRLVLWGIKYDFPVVIKLMSIIKNIFR